MVQNGEFNRQDESLDSRDKSNLIIGKLDETLRVLAEFQPRKASIKPSKESLEPSLTEKAEGHVKKAIESLGLQQVLDVFSSRRRTIPKQLAELFGIAADTACKHLRGLEQLGCVRRVKRGLYEILF